MKEIYLTIAGRIQREIPEINHLVERCLKIWSHASKTADDYYIDATAFAGFLEHLSTK